MNLQTVEIKAFVPAKNFELSKRFYQDLGFSMESSTDDVAYICYGNCAFLLQNFHVQAFAENLMMHLLVDSADDWWQHVQQSGVVGRYGVRAEAPQDQPWGMRDFVLFDPSGVLWRIGHNLD
jgi:uncharacterized glyoxalase superfamily protein PhnB